MSGRISIHTIAVLLLIPASLIAQGTAGITGTVDNSASLLSHATDLTTNAETASVPSPESEPTAGFRGSFTINPHMDFLRNRASTFTFIHREPTGDPCGTEIGTPYHEVRLVLGETANRDGLAQQPFSIACDPSRGAFTTAATPTMGSGPEILDLGAAALSGDYTDPDEPSEQQPGATPPKVRHTGFKALEYDTVSDFKAFPRRRSTWVILGIGGALALAVHPADDDVTKDLSDSETAKDVFKAGKYIGSVPVQAGVAAGLLIVGRYVIHPDPGGARTNKVSHMGFDLLRGLAVSQGLTQLIKVTVRRDRPDGQCCAFPSGHASAAFATASILERHFGYRGAWPTWLIASYVGASRLADNRHFLSDVMFGAALGVASGWTVVGRHGRSDFTLVPVPTRGGVMISLVRRARTETQSEW
jgi:PAP2 superfamily